MMQSISTLRGLRSDMLIPNELPSLSCPTLFLWGDADSFAPPALGQEVADTMSDARVQVVSDAVTVPAWISLQSSPKRLGTSPGKPSPSAITARAGAASLDGRRLARRSSSRPRLRGTRSQVDHFFPAANC